jgi:hypothetical protein
LISGGAADNALVALIAAIRNDPHRKLKVILADGGDPTEEVAPLKDILHRIVNDPKSITSSEHLTVWRFYEYARLKTSNQYPDPLMYYLLRLTEENIVSTVVTTNYDSYWRSIKQRRASNVRLLINPLSAAPTEDGYYEKPPTRHLKKCLTLFAIHGSLDFIRFENCAHRFRLPSFFINSNPGYDLPELRAPYHWWFDHHGTVCKPDSLYRHDIDWLNNDNRAPYATEIQQAIADISDTATTAGILVLGFTGYCHPDPTETRRQEELTDALEDIARKTDIAIWLVYQARQYQKMIDLARLDHCLPGRLNGYSSVYSRRSDVKLETWLRELLKKHERTTGIRASDWYRGWSRAWRKQPGKFLDRSYFEVLRP